MIRTKAGYLQKSKGGWKSRRGDKQLTSYFFRLNATYFQQLANEHDTVPKKSPLVSDIQDVLIRDIEKLSFDVRLRKEGTWTLVASTRKELFDWMEALLPGSTSKIEVPQARRHTIEPSGSAAHPSVPHVQPTSYPSDTLPPPYSPPMQPTALPPQTQSTVYSPQMQTTSLPPQMPPMFPRLSQPHPPVYPPLMSTRRSSEPVVTSMQPCSTSRDPRYVTNQENGCCDRQRSLTSSHGNVPNKRNPHHPLQFTQSLPPNVSHPSFLSKQDSIISQPDDDNNDGLNADRMYMVAGERSTSLSQPRVQRMISIDDGGYIPMSLQSPVDAQDLSPTDKDYYMEPSAIMSRYARPSVRNIAGQNLSFSSDYLVPVSLTPPLEKRMRHQSMVQESGEVHRLPARAFIGAQGTIDVPESDNVHHCLKRLPNISRDKLILQREIAKGNFSVVYQAVYKVGNTPAAAKVLKFSYSEKDFNDFIKEAYIINQLHHPNIIDFYGVVHEVSPPYLVIELMENGALDLFLRRVEGRRSLGALMRYVANIVAGMIYLSQRKFVHRDLAARNVLVSRNECCKIADFGLSRKLDQQSMYVSQGGRVATKWAAPEALTEQQYTTESDVWSFGIVMWEVMMFGETPYGDWTGEKTILEVTNNHHRLAKPKICPPRLYLIMSKCWDQHPKGRPSFSEISEQLNSVSLSEIKL